MKKILMTLAMGMMALTMSAQMYVGGSVGFSSWSPDKGDGETSFKFLPEFGMQFDETWGAGVQIGYVTDKAGVYNLGTESAFLFSPYVRFTALKAGKLNLFLDGGIEFISYSKPDNSAFSIGIKPGVSVALTDKLSFVSHFGFLGYESVPSGRGGYDYYYYDYSRAASSSNDKPKDSFFGFDFDTLNLTFGLYYNF